MLSAISFANIYGSMRIPKANTEGSEVNIHAPRQVKSALKSLYAPKRRRGKRTVHFKGMVSPTFANVVSLCVQYTRAGSYGAERWEDFMAVVVTLDFFCVASAIVSAAYSRALYRAHLGTGGTLDFTYLLLALDIVFFLNIAFTSCQVRHFACLKCTGCMECSSCTCMH